METGELSSMETMETLTELGDELTLGDIDGECLGQTLLARSPLAWSRCGTQARPWLAGSRGGGGGGAASPARSRPPGLGAGQTAG